MAGLQKHSSYGIKTYKFEILIIQFPINILSNIFLFCTSNLCNFIL